MGCSGGNMAVKVKICGITNLEDGLVAVEAGAEALGFILCESSPRYVPMPTAAAIIQKLPTSLLKVGVFVDAEAEFVYRAIKECRLSVLQFHGDETPEFCLQFGLMTIKAFPIKNAASLLKVANFK